MREAGIPLTFYRIRLDSGDLAYLSKKAKKMLDAAGFSDAVISASNDLDENLISSCQTEAGNFWNHILPLPDKSNRLQGAAINSWGVGTNLITSKEDARIPPTA